MLLSRLDGVLYHYERKLGTTTSKFRAWSKCQIIPLREKIGNYDYVITRVKGWAIIPLREKIGNYDPVRDMVIYHANYTTTRENWELRPFFTVSLSPFYYTTTRENWELRQSFHLPFLLRRLYHYERKLGTTTCSAQARSAFAIIPLREKIGNYDSRVYLDSGYLIIPLREKIGNYDAQGSHRADG